MAKTKLYTRRQMRQYRIYRQHARRAAMRELEGRSIRKAGWRW